MGWGQAPELLGRRPPPPPSPRPSKAQEIPPATGSTDRLQRWPPGTGWAAGRGLIPPPWSRAAVLPFQWVNSAECLDLERGAASHRGSRVSQPCLDPCGSETQQWGHMSAGAFLSQEHGRWWVHTPGTLGLEGTACCTGSTGLARNWPHARRVSCPGCRSRGHTAQACRWPDCQSNLPESRGRGHTSQ